MLFSVSKRYKIKAGSYVSGFLPPKGSGGMGLGISRGGTGHWWHHLCPCNYRVLGANTCTLKFSVYSLPACAVASSISPTFWGSQLSSREQRPPSLRPQTSPCASGLPHPGTASPRAAGFGATHCLPRILPAALDPLLVLNLFCPKLRLGFFCLLSLPGNLLFILFFIHSTQHLNFQIPPTREWFLLVITKVTAITALIHY